MRNDYSATKLIQKHVVTDEGGMQKNKVQILKNIFCMINTE